MDNAEQMIADVEELHGKEIAKSMRMFVHEKGGPLLTHKEFMQELEIQSLVNTCETVDGLMRI